MNKELTEKLWNDFPNLYKDKDASIRCSLIPFGFECLAGWEPLIRELSIKLEKLIIEYKKEYPNEEYYPRASQVKEKYGTLRFYMTTSTDEMENLIDEAEGKSAKTCEECGKDGELRITGGTPYGWHMTRCEKCAIDRDGNRIPMYEEIEKEDKGMII